MMIALILAIVFAVAPIANIEDLEWLTGRWRAEKAGLRDEARYTEEVWLKASGDKMFGVSRTMHMRETESFEYLRIEEEGRSRMVLIAQPNGGEPVRFDMISHAPGEIVFENRSHDYPQRVRYKRIGNRLHATISLADGTNPTNWNYRLQAPDR